MNFDMLTRWITDDPKAALIEIDREAVRQGGLRTFCELAWPVIEAEGTFSPGWHIDAICEHLEAVSRGEMKRVAIAQPPRSMKSTLVSVMWPAWDWIAHPQRRFLYASYASDLALRDAQKSRRIIESPWYQDRWGESFSIMTDANRKEFYQNNKGGDRMSTSVDAKVTGFGGDIVVCDDANNVRDAESDAVREGTLRWWSESMPSRLNDPKTGAFVIVQQRVHTRDLIGYVLTRPTTKPYTYLCLPAEYDPDHPHRWARDPRTVPGELLWPDHMPRAELEELKASLGPYAAASQLNQLPSPREGGIFKRAWFPLVPLALVPPDTQWSRAWDLAASVKSLTRTDPDWTATALVGFSASAKRFYIKEVQRWRMNAHEVEQLIKLKAVADGYLVRQTVPKDPGQAGVSQGQNLLLLLAGWPVELEPQTGDKAVRASPLAGQAAGGMVQMVEGDWNDNFLAEITCLDKDTEITTLNGPKPIATVQVGDLVMTRIGWRRVLKAGKTGIAPLCEISFSNGRSIRATHNHPIFVPAYGFMRTDHVAAGDELLQFTEVSPLSSTRESDTSKLCSAGSAGNCTAISTSKKSVQSQTGSTSTTRMAIPSTTSTSATSPASPHPNTHSNTIHRAGSAQPTSADASYAASYTRAVKAHGLTNTAHTGAPTEPVQLKAIPSYQEPAGPATEAISADRGHSIAQTPVTTGHASTEFRKGIVSDAADYSGPNSVMPGFAISHVQIAQVRLLDGLHDVYNLEVEGVPEYVAAGILVHNCFPKGSHDDMVDAVASAFNRLTGGTTGIMDFYSAQLAVKRSELEKVKAVTAISEERRTTDFGDLMRANLHRAPGA